MNWHGVQIKPWKWPDYAVDELQSFYLRVHGHIPLLFLAPKLFGLGRIRRQLLCWWYKR